MQGSFYMNAMGETKGENAGKRPQNVPGGVSPFFCTLKALIFRGFFYFVSYIVSYTFQDLSEKRRLKYCVDLLENSLILSGKA